MNGNCDSELELLDGSLLCLLILAKFSAQKLLASASPPSSTRFPSRVEIKAKEKVEKIIENSCP